MNVWILIAVSIVALFVIFIASVTLKKSSKSNNFHALAAEDLLGMVMGVRLDSMANPGDAVEIIVKVNGHPIVGYEYTATDWCGRLKLNAKTEG